MRSDPVTGATIGEVGEPGSILDRLGAFDRFGSSTDRGECGGVPTFTNEFWTSGQRRGHGLHEISYRACFKPQLPAFFLDLLSPPGGHVHDPFMGRGTTVVEAALRGHPVSGTDVNPLSGMLVSPRLDPPTIEEVELRLMEIDLEPSEIGEFDELLAFYHPETLGRLISLRQWFLEREQGDPLDRTDAFIRMVAMNRLTGHSPGFFSVYTLPPNQAVSVERQREINRKRGQTPPERDIEALIMKKTKSLLRDLTESERGRLAELPRPGITVGKAWETTSIDAGSVEVVVTSPPFLDVVDYRADNWLRCWFAGIDPEQVEISSLVRVEDWREMVHRTLTEQARLLGGAGFVCFEVGEVRGGKVRLEETVIQASVGTGLHPICVVINAQEFTKTSHLWGVSNGAAGTNSNRIVVLAAG